jgi:CHAD domain-containing protein
VRAWPLDRVDPAALREGLARIYRRARKAYSAVRADPKAENLHEWRKQVKYLEQALHAWKPCATKRVDDVLRRADKLAEILGTDHDLFVFAQRLHTLAAPDRARSAIERFIAARRCCLQERALKRGRRLFAEKPREFVRRVARPTSSSHIA